MKKQSADQQFHDRRHQQRQRANAAKKKSVPRKEQAQPVATKDLSGARNMSPDRRTAALSRLAQYPVPSKPGTSE
jgi:hypothetical protein